MPTNDPPDPHLFIFDLDLGIRDQVIKALAESPLLPLTKGVGPRLSGIYALYWKGELVYIGKATKELTKSKRDLRARLNEHVGKIETRDNIALADVQCRFLTFESEWWVIAAEYALIVHHVPEWNNSGFGSKAEGVVAASCEISFLISGLNRSKSASRQMEPPRASPVCSASLTSRTPLYVGSLAARGAVRWIIRAGLLTRFFFLIP